MLTDRCGLRALIGGTIGFLAMVAGGSLVAQTAKPAPFDKTVNMYVGMPPGGSIDVFARLIQRHLSRFLPGTPTIVVLNKPGAGSLLSVLAVANSPPADGLVMGTFSSALIPNAIAEPERFRIDFRHFRFIGNVGEDYRVCYVRTETGIHSLQELADRKEVIFAATAAGTSGNLNLAILKDLFKVKLKQVQGYPGSAAKRLAFERGEVDGDCGGIDTLPQEWLAQRRINILVRFLPNVLPPVDPSVPFAGDLLTDPASRQLFDFLAKPARMLGTVLVPDTTPKDKVDTLRQAFDTMVVDPDFVADAQKTGFPLSPLSGADVDREIATLYATPPQVLEKAKALLTE
jgi:tripartite-type tricarboxylate transporter receptor subunit TctC